MECRSREERENVIVFRMREIFDFVQVNAVSAG